MSRGRQSTCLKSRLNYGFWGMICIKIVTRLMRGQVNSRAPINLKVANKGQKEVEVRQMEYKIPNLCSQQAY